YAGGDGNDVALIVAGSVVYNDANAGDNLELRQIATGGSEILQLLVNGVLVDSRPSASVPSYTVNGNGGSDILTVNYGASGGSFATATHAFTTTGPAQSGDILYDTGAQTAIVSYTGLGLVDMTGTTIANLIFNLPGAADQPVLEDDARGGNSISQLRSQS